MELFFMKKNSTKHYFHRLNGNVWWLMASLKAAKTSYFKTDFAWALKQFKELKSQIRS
jgi:hypothetical protein